MVFKMLILMIRLWTVDTYIYIVRGSGSTTKIKENTSFFNFLREKINKM